MSELHYTQPEQAKPAPRTFYVSGMVGFAIQAENEAQAVERAHQLPVSVVAYGLRATVLEEQRH